MIFDRCRAEALFLVEFAEIPVRGEARDRMIDVLAAGMRRSYTDCLKKVAALVGDRAAFLDGDPAGTLWQFGDQLLGIIERGLLKMAAEIDSIDAPWPQDGTGEPLRGA